MFKAAVIQMVSTPDLDANLEQADGLLREAARRGARFALLPEYFPILSDDETAKIAVCETLGHGPIQDFLAAQAKEHALWLMAGAIPLQSERADRVYNSCLLFDPDGRRTHRYDKMHLFDVRTGDEEKEVYNESNTIVAGHNIVVAQTPLARIGMSICYDLRFPELYRALCARQAELLAVPSAFTYTTGRRHWETLLRARAVENLCYVVAANQGGQNTETRRTWGHSMIIDPWGDTLCSLEEGPGVACAALDLTRLHELRESFPALQHRTL